MVNHHDEIDDLFRQRFDGLRDNSVNAKAQWVPFQSQLSNTALASTTAGSGSVYSGLSLSGIAASVVTGVVLIGLATGDNPNQVGFDTVTIAQTSAALQLESDETTKTSTRFAAESQAASQPEVVVAQASSMASNPLDVSAHSLDNITDRDKILDRATESYAQYPPTPVHSISREWESSHTLTSQLTDVSASANERQNIQLMEARTPEFNSIEIIDRPTNYDIVKFDPSWASDHSFYFRGGVRVGSGESNSREVESRWMANAFGGFGYEYTLSSNWTMSAEVDWLRRSGMGIERTRELDVSPIASAISGYTNTSIEGYNSRPLEIREGLIATRMDYVHFPFAVHYHGFSKRVSASIGGFVDYLISARNEAFIIYNNTEYSASAIGINEISLQDGLSRTRYGLSFGADYDFTDRWTGTFVGMAPLNSPVSQDSDYSVIDHSNILVDFQFGLKFRFI